ncbi:MAG: DUF1844 domain-containing protein [Deltaproteobacteria bacterium]|nr:DUF1844 domain-containing protein [Deltaproteobacteria bacterium]
MEEEKKGFKVVDKRGLEKEERETPAASPSPPPQQPEPPKETGNRPGPQDVKGEESPGAEPSSIGGPQFLDLVGMLQFGAMANMGMIRSSEGKRSPVNLPAAKDSIDLLSVLQEKTKGNLTEEETGILSEGLYHLRMGYLELMKAGQEKGGKGK